MTTNAEHFLAFPHGWTEDERERFREQWIASRHGWTEDERERFREQWIASRHAETVNPASIFDPTDVEDNGSGILVAAIAGLVMGMAFAGIILGSVLA